MNLIEILMYLWLSLDYFEFPFSGNQINVLCCFCGLYVAPNFSNPENNETCLPTCFFFGPSFTLQTNIFKLYVRCSEGESTNFSPATDRKVVYVVTKYFLLQLNPSCEWTLQLNLLRMALQDDSAKMYIVDMVSKMYIAVMLSDVNKL